jgi:type VI secretion system secreted protein Hcp
MIQTSRPSTLSRTLALVPPAIALVAQHASGAFDIFIKIGDIKGESMDAKHAEWIQLEAFQWGLARAISSPTGGGNNREASAPSISEMTLSKKVDRSTPKLFLNAVGGSGTIPEVILELQDQSSQKGVFYRITLNDVLVSSQSHVAAAGGDVPQESVSLNFLKIKVEYFYRDPKGNLIAEPAVSYDLSTTKSS